MSIAYMRTRSPARHALALLLLVAAIGLYFLPWLSLRRAFFQVDIAFMDHPTRVHAFAMLQAGHFPFWSNRLLCGFPLFAEGQAAVLYPPSWLYYALAPETALNLFVVGHYLLLGLSAYLFLSRTLSSVSALFGALTLVFSSFMLVQHVLISFLSVAAWTPLLLWLVARAAETMKGRHVAGAALVIAVMHVAGDPFGTLLSILLVSAFGLDQILGWPDRHWRRVLLALALPVVLGTLLAAVQLLPTYEFLRESTRGQGPAVTLDQFVPAKLLLTAAFPNFFGDSLAHYLGPARPGWEESVLFFVGWSALFLLPFGLAGARRATVWILAAALGVLLSVRELAAVTTSFWAIPPFAFFRWPTHALVWYAFGLSFVSAQGLENLRNGLPPHRLRVCFLLFAALVVAASGAFVTLHGLSLFGDGLPIGGGDVDFAWFAASASIWAVALWAHSRPHCASARWVQGAAFGCLAAGVLVNQKPGGISPVVYAEKPDTAHFLQERYGAGRIYAPTPWLFPAYPTDETSMRTALASLPANSHLRYGLGEIGQFDFEWTTTLRRNRNFLLLPTSQLLDLLAVDAVVVPRSSTAVLALIPSGFHECLVGTARVHCRDRPAPRAFLSRSFRVGTEKEIAAALENETTDPRSSVWLELAPTWRGATGPEGSYVDAVSFRRDEPGHVLLDVEASERSLLVLADSYYPGWRAHVDGDPAEILPAYGFLRAVAVPAGRHHVAFTYHERFLGYGLALSAAGLLVTGLLAFGRFQATARSVS